MIESARSLNATRFVRDNPRAAWGTLVALAIVSGLLSALTFTYVKSYVPATWLAELPLLRWPFALSPGLWFGMLIGGYLLALGRTGPARAVAFAALATGAWAAGYSAGVITSEFRDEWLGWSEIETIAAFFGVRRIFPGVALIGIIWGSVNALGVALAAAILFPASRRLGHLALMVAAGAAAGTLLGLYADREWWGYSQGGPELFCAWQGAVAAVLGHAIFIVKPKARAG